MSQSRSKVYLNILLKPFLLLTFLAVYSSSVVGQTEVGSGFKLDPLMDSTKVDTLLFDIDLDISDQLLPLDTILYIAYENSPNLKFEQASIQSKKHDLNYTRILFFQGLFPFFTYSYGDQSLLYNTSAAGIGNSYQLSNGSRFGFTVQIPISTLLGQGQRNKVVRQQIVAAEYHREQAKRDLRREILRVYVDMLEAQRKVRIRVDDAQTILVALDVAYEEMIEGKTPPMEYARIRNIYANTQTNLETERANFLSAFLDFETLVGVDMKYLKKQAEKKVDNSNNGGNK
jgi:outer membrane protein TolC